ncbi:MAG: DUF927 domain-containing protein, partial [Selenomonadaceae bacterium]|nr:DUF927 domain-containing protein [Selenomonadaceae bacterium]
MQQQSITPQGEKKYTTKEFVTLTGITRGTLSRWVCEGKLIPAVQNGKGKPSYYSAAQIEVAKKLFGKSTEATSANVIPLFGTNEEPAPATTNADSDSATTLQNSEKSIEPVDTPADNSKTRIDTRFETNGTDDDELIDPPTQANCVFDSPVEITANGYQGLENSTKAVIEETATKVEEKISCDATNNGVAVPAAEKNFLPMTIQPAFENIPQVLKDLSRWLCWRLIPADPKPKKVPMSPKNGRLVNASVTAPNNWLTFDEAISWYNRGECSGIGFALTNTPPKVCCVDVDHCVNPDGTLTAEAQAVMETCQNSFTEKSQSLTGIHIWFIDDDFNGGRKKDPVEVYAADRYICMTGVRVLNSSEELKTVNGACNAVIAKFIGDRGGNLFDKSAASVENSPTENFLQKSAESLIAETAAPMTDADRELVKYFRSDKCRQRDLNMFNLFSGNTAEYFKNTGKPVDDSVADCDLMLKILYYIVNAPDDAKKGQRALNIFGQSELSKRAKWIEREDYRIRTLAAAFDIWVENGRKTIKTTATDDGTAPDDDPIAALKAELREVNKAIVDFNAQKDAATKKLRDVETFDSETVFSEEVTTAAAFARLFDKQTFSDFRREVKNYGDKHKDEKVSVTDWLSEVKERAAEINNRKTDLTTRRNEIQAEIDSLSFVQSLDALKNFVIPSGYSVSAEYGIEKIEGEKSIPVCIRPVIITGKTYSVEDKIFKLNLAYMTASGKLETLDPTEAATVFNKNKLVDLSNSGLPVTTTNATHLVDYLYNFSACNENTLPLTKCVNRCGWQKFDGKEYFIDPRRPCVIPNEDKNFRVSVDDVRSEFAKHLKQVGSLDEWKKIYKLAKKSPVARLSVAASVAPILLDVLGERNFLLYIVAPTRAGKTTALHLGASAVGDEKIIRSFDATKNGLAGAAADVNDYVFCVDEKQVADNYLKDQFNNLVYALANGLGRTKLNKDSTLKKMQDWRTIAIMTGETQMLSDNVTGGANTRLLTIKAPKEILSATDCKIIRDIIKNNHGHALPKVIDKVQEIGRDKLREIFEEMIDVFEAKFPEILPEYRRYMAVLTLADTLLNAALFGNTVETADGKTIKASDDAIINAAKIFPLIPTIAEISDTPREKEFVRGIIAKNQNSFVGGVADIKHMKAIAGKLNTGDGFIYIT